MTFASNRLFCSLSLSFLLAACGGGGGGTTFVPVPVPAPAPAPAPAVDSLQPYREQALAWTACDPTVLGMDTAGTREIWARLGERLQCATLRAPLDYQNPVRGDAAISVMRVAVADASQRRGALVFNPGGPGEDGLAHTFGLIRAFADSEPTNPLGALQLRLLAEYDMVGFSPRGTGNSTTLTCTTNELARSVERTVPEAFSVQNFDNALYNARLAAQACKKNPLTPFINTEATVQDMDLLRGLLGDDKLNYLGYSYGTWLGAWYANRFPERVGRMVLDSNTDFSATSSEPMYLLQPVARQRMLEEVMLPYAARHDAYFHLGDSATKVKAVLAGLSPRIRSLLAGSLDGLGYSRHNTDEYVFSIVAARGLQEVLQAGDETDDDAILQALATKTFVPGDLALDAQVRHLAVSFYNGYFGQWVQPSPAGSFAISRSEATLAAVRCNDTPSTTDPQFWLDTGRDYAQRYPMFFPLLLPGTVSCIYWKGPVVQKPDVSAMQGLDVMLLQSEYDTATATEGARAFFAALPKAHGVFVPGEFTHGVYPYVDTCVDTAVTRYLLGESPAARTTVCPATPMPQDKLAAATRLRAAKPTNSAYKDPEQAMKWIEQFKRGIGPGQ